MRRTLRLTVGVGVVLVGIVAGLGGSGAPAQNAPDEPAALVGNRSSKVFHRLSCASARRLAEGNRVPLASADEAQAQGFTPCRICQPSDGPGSAPALRSQGLSSRSRARADGAVSRTALENPGDEADDDAPQAVPGPDDPAAEPRPEPDLARLSPEQREQRLSEIARQRWSKADPDAEPEMVASPHFVLFSNLPPSRANATLRALEGRVPLLRNLLSMPDRPALQWSEKVSLYVFNDRPSYVEFVRGNENREADRDAEAHARLDVEVPYIAAVDPLAGREDSASGRRSPRSRRDEDDTGPERTLAGLLIEQLGEAATAQTGNPPRWLSLGLGAYLASQVEPRSPYYRRLRAEVLQQYQLGWTAKATEALGGTTDDAKIRALGFSLIEWLVATQRAQFPFFVRGMLEGQEKLDDGIRALWNIDREQFLQAWGNWVLTRYGRAVR